MIFSLDWVAVLKIAGWSFGAFLLGVIVGSLIPGGEPDEWDDCDEDIHNMNFSRGYDGLFQGSVDPYGSPKDEHVEGWNVPAKENKVWGVDGK